MSNVKKDIIYPLREKKAIKEMTNVRKNRKSYTPLDYSIGIKSAVRNLDFNSINNESSKPEQANSFSLDEFPNKNKSNIA